jgi:hypothetical protein
MARSTMAITQVFLMTIYAFSSVGIRRMHVRNLSDMLLELALASVCVLALYRPIREVAITSLLLIWLLANLLRKRASVGHDHRL